jgi:signal transduction histidine kinase
LIINRDWRFLPSNLQKLINLTGSEYDDIVTKKTKTSILYGTAAISVSFLLCFLFWLLVFLNQDQRLFKYVALLSTTVFLSALGSFANVFFDFKFNTENFIFIITNSLFLAMIGATTLLVTEYVLLKKTSLYTKCILVLMPIVSFTAHVYNISAPFGIVNTSLNIYMIYLIFKTRKQISGAQWAVVIAMVLPTLGSIFYVTMHKYFQDSFYHFDKLTLTATLLSAPFFLMVYISFRFKEVLNEVADKAQNLVNVTIEKQEILANQNEKLEIEVEARTADLKNSLENLKTAQTQLVHSEKMASLGELTAGIAHEIQNPLNFVNNFSEVSNELITELKQEKLKSDVDRDPELEDEILTDISQNLEKINHHGKRADAIIKGMLQHSRTQSGKKEPKDINALCDEYIRLTYHGLRAKNPEFNSKIVTDFDTSLPPINIIHQDMGRVILNLLTNAFYAVREKAMVENQIRGEHESSYKPEVLIATKRNGDKVEICVSDNGNGIPDNIKDKIFQPFFTTKPTGQGTGLGLSLSYDIITKVHEGSLTVISSKDKGTSFTISLNI